MSRQIVTQAHATRTKATGNTSPKKEDPYTTMILKLIPAEFVSVYLAAFNIIKSYDSKPDNSILQWIVFVLMLGILPFYLKWTSVDSNKQVILTFISFIIWVFTLGGPLDGTLIGGYPPQFLGSIILPIYTLFIPALYQKITN